MKFQIQPPWLTVKRFDGGLRVQSPEWRWLLAIILLAGYGHASDHPSEDKTPIISNVSQQRRSETEGQPRSPLVNPAISYTNERVAKVPWSIHVVKVGRSAGWYGIHTVHAQGCALGLSTLRDQVAAVNPRLGTPIAAINGGFYQRDKAYAGAARGLQIAEGEVLSAPSGSPTFWIDAFGQAQLTNVISRFQVTWPDGQATPFTVNEGRSNNAMVLYTPAIGPSTLTEGGIELVLEPQPGSRWLPLGMGRICLARVREVRSEGNTPLVSNTMVLSLGPAIKDRGQNLGPGALLQISTASVPSLRGVKTALSAGPVLVREGRRQKFRAAPDDAYELSSMLEQHPRSALGWNQQWFFLVQVDGRQRDLSVGMTLDELASYLVNLGCEQALNLDGGGSSTLWHDGDVRNNPCDGYERKLANSIVVVRKNLQTGPLPSRPPEVLKPTRPP